MIRTFTNVKRWVTLLLFAFCVLGAQAATMRVYLIGNSVTDAVNYAGLKALAESRGNTHTYARHMIPGSPLNILWDNRNGTSGFTESPYGYPQNAFTNYVWDAITLQPFDRHLDGTEGDGVMVNNYINLAKGNSPNVQFFIYQRWVRTPNSLAPTDASLTADTWNNLWLRTYTGGWDQTEESKDYFERLTNLARTNNPTVKKVLMIPVGQVFYDLNNKMKAGQVPGYTKIWSFYSDGIHMNNVGSYAAAVCFYSALYGADPRGLGVPSQYGTIPSAVVTAIQESVWSVMTTYKDASNNTWSGLAGTSVAVTGVSVSPTTLTVNAGSTGTITATVAPANATNKSVNWTSSNTNVATVNASGVVTGVSAGTATITATTADGAKTSTCSVTVNATGGGTNFTGVLATWDFATKGGQSNIAATSTASGVTASTSIGSGLSAINYLSNGFTASGQTATTLAAALSGNDYLSFTVTPSAGSSISVTKINIRPVSQNRQRSFALYASNKGFTAGNEIATYTANANTGAAVQSFTITGVSNIQGAVEFRLYAYGYTDNYEALGIGNRNDGVAGTDLSVEGSISSSSVAVTGVSLNSTSLILNPGATSQLTASVAPVNATNKTVSWSSSNTSVATVSSTGLVTAVAAGTATITVTTQDGNKTATCSVRTNAKPTSVFNATPQSGTAPLTVNFDGTVSTDPDAGDFILGFNWNFGDGSAMDYSNKPSHTYTAAGTYTVTFRAMDNHDLYGDQVTKTITVTAPSGGTTGTLASWDFAGKGGQSNIAASTILSGVASATTSVGSGLSAINYLTNGFTASGQTATTLAAALSGNDYLSFTVTPSSGSSLTVSKVSIRPVSQNRQRSFALYSSVNGFTAGNEIATFTGSANNGAALQAFNVTNINGVASAIEFRLYVYGYTDNYEAVGVGNRNAGVAEADFIVEGSTSSGSIAVTGVSVSPTTASVNVGATTSLTATVAPSNATNKTVSWSSSNTAVATVSSSGVVTGVAAGSATITATTQDGNKTATCAVTVTAAPSLRNPENPANTVAGLDYNQYNGSWDLLPDFNALTPATSGTISTFDISSKAGTDNFGFKFTGYISVPTDGTYNFYTSSDDGSRLYIGSTMVVDNDGLHATQERTGAIGLKAGKHAITVNYFEKTGGEALTVSYAGPGISKTVVPASVLYRVAGATVAVTGVSVSPTSATVTVGATTTLTATVAPSNATNKTVTWSSSNISVATVSSSGVVTGVAVGSATITVTTQDGAKTATCAVTVQSAGSSIAISIDKNAKNQTIDGFGFFGPMHTWWDSSDPNYFYSDAWLNMVLSDLGITIWRDEYYPPAITSGMPEAQYVVSQNWFQDANWNKQKNTVLAFKNKAASLGVDLKFILTVWSPPAAFKCPYDASINRVSGTHYTGGTKGGGALDPIYYADFANWLKQGIQNYKDLGIDLYALSPQNEPYFNQPYNSCFYKQSWYVEMLNAVIPTVKASFPNVKIFGSENMLDMEGRDINWPWFYHSAIKNDATARNYIDIFAVHGYSDGVAASSGSNLANYWTNHKNQFTQPLNKKAWMTETSGYADSWESTADKPGSLALASDILNGLVFGDMSGWVYWYGSDGDLMDITTPKKPYYACKQFYRYIRPGAVRVNASSADNTIAVGAFEHTSMGTNTIVLINTNSTAKNITLSGVTGNFEMFATSATDQCVSKGTFAAGATISLPARSVVTLVSGGTALKSATVVNEATAVNEVENSVKLSVYPNPADNLLNVNFGSVVNNAVLSVVDLNGREVLVKQVSNTETEQVEVGHLSKGFYLLRFTDGKNVVKTKFMKK